MGKVKHKFLNFNDDLLIQQQVTSSWDWESFYSNFKVKQQERRRMLASSHHNLLEQRKLVGYSL